MELSLESVRQAKKKNIRVSCDLNYRKNLWKSGGKNFIFCSIAL